MPVSFSNSGTWDWIVSPDTFLLAMTRIEAPLKACQSNFWAALMPGRTSNEARSRARTSEGRTRHRIIRFPPLCTAGLRGRPVNRRLRVAAVEWRLPSPRCRHEALPGSARAGSPLTLTLVLYHTHPAWASEVVDGIGW